MKYILKEFTLLIFSLTLILSSCNPYNSIDIGKVTDVKFRSLVDNKISLDLSVPIKNSNRFNIEIKSMDLNISVNGKYIGKIKNENEILISKKFDGIQIIPVEIEVENILSSAMTIYKLQKAKRIEVFIDGKIIAGTFLHRKTIKISEKQMVDL